MAWAGQVDWAGLGSNLLFCCYFKVSAATSGSTTNLVIPFSLLCSECTV